MMSRPSKLKKAIREMEGVIEAEIQKWNALQEHIQHSQKVLEKLKKIDEGENEKNNKN